MELQVGHSRVELVIGDITLQKVDAIVNAANSSLLGGGGVDGAIHRAAGPQLLAACREVGGCPTGHARITPAFNLNAQWVIHAVGPVYEGGDPYVAYLLCGAYWDSMFLAHTNDARSVAFPAISTGIFSYPLKEAADIALTTTIDYLRGSRFETEVTIEVVRFVLFDQKTYDVFEETLNEKEEG